jgi:proton-translocating NAD(P)+ transhydrogenase subunit alpha
VIHVMKVGIPKETTPGEKRVALVPELVSKLKHAGLEVCLQIGAGIDAGFADEEYADAGATIRPEALDTEMILKVRPPTSNEIAAFRQNSIVIGLLEPYSKATPIQLLADRKVTALAMELMPRIARAQPMDALSAMSTIAGYKAVLLAANHLPKFFPLLMTAAGTMPPARVFVIGAGVAGLEAIGTAKRLGAVVEAYDTRPAVKEEVESVGAKFVELALDTSDAADTGGYARAQAEDFYKRQQQMMVEHVTAADVVITAALVRGAHAPVLITEEMVRNMRPGSVIVDLAADQGGNCALTESGRDVLKHGVAILGPSNLPSSMPFHASKMYARTVTNFLLHLVREGKIHIDLDDELTRSTLVTHRGEIVNEPIRAKLIP